MCVCAHMRAVMHAGYYFLNVKSIEVKEAENLNTWRKIVNFFILCPHFGHTMAIRTAVCTDPLA